MIWNKENANVSSTQAPSSGAGGPTRDGATGGRYTPPFGPEFRADGIRLAQRSRISVKQAAWELEIASGTP